MGLTARTPPATSKSQIHVQPSPEAQGVQQRTRTAEGTAQGNFEQQPVEVQLAAVRADIAIVMERQKQLSALLEEYKVQDMAASVADMVKTLKQVEKDQKALG